MLRWPQLSRTIASAMAPLALLVWCGGPPELPEASADASSPDPALPCIAPLVVESCAVAQCHDALTKEHNMDLSSGTKIFEAWVDRNGLDHCSNMLRTRIVPGDPAASYVLEKITGMLPCQNELSQPMPPPPRAPLSPEQIETIRAWIAAGARLDCSGEPPLVQDASLDMDSSDAEPPIESGTVPDVVVDAQPDRISDIPGCSADDPCLYGEVCVGDNCGAPWQCFTHYVEPPLEHPCPEEIQTYCGCDGVTFEAQSTCPDRPYLHPGACGDGVSCDTYDATCDLPAPSCPEGMLASIVDGCFGECVPLASCRCEYNWECPWNRCIFEEKRCAPFEVSDAGDAGDAG